MSPPALPVRSMVSPPVRSQSSPRQQISPRPNSRSSSVDESEASNDVVNEVRRLFNALRSAATRFRNQKFRMAIKKMMAENPYELLEIAVEKYEFVLPKDISMERAKAILTKRNVALLGEHQNISSPGML